MGSKGYVLVAGTQSPFGRTPLRKEAAHRPILHAQLEGYAASPELSHGQGIAWLIPTGLGIVVVGFHYPPPPLNPKTKRKGYHQVGIFSKKGAPSNTCWLIQAFGCNWLFEAILCGIVLKLNTNGKTGNSTANTDTEM